MSNITIVNRWVGQLIDTHRSDLDSMVHLDAFLSLRSGVRNLRGVPIERQATGHRTHFGPGHWPPIAHQFSWLPAPFSTGLPLKRGGDRNVIEWLRRQCLRVDNRTPDQLSRSCSRQLPLTEAYSPVGQTSERFTRNADGRTNVDGLTRAR